MAPCDANELRCHVGEPRCITRVRAPGIGNGATAMVRVSRAGI
jgi:hypothetical protein